MRSEKNKKQRNKRIIFILIIFCICSLSLFSIITNFRENIIFFYSPSDLQNIKNKNQIIRVGGLVKIDSIKKISSIKTEFILTDLTQEVRVSYQGILPDLFREDQGMVAKGLLKNDVFIAKELLAKHDENYMPPEVYKSLKKKK